MLFYRIDFLYRLEGGQANPAPTWLSWMVRPVTGLVDYNILGDWSLPAVLINILHTHSLNQLNCEPNGCQDTLYKFS